MMSKEEVWGEEETKLYEAIIKTQDINVLQPLFDNLKRPNAFHLWKDVRSINFTPIVDYSRITCKMAW